MTFRQAMAEASLAAYMYQRPYCLVGARGSLNVVDRDTAIEGDMLILETVSPIQEAA